MELRMNVAIGGVYSILGQIRGFEKDAQSVLTQIAERMADRTAEETEKRLRAPKSGRKYSKYPNPSGVQPGYPAAQWGHLIDSFNVRITGEGEATLTIGETLPRPYAIWLELGWHSKDGGYHVFPFVRPTVESMRDEYTGIVREEVAKHIK